MTLAARTAGVGLPDPLATVLVCKAARLSDVAGIVATDAIADGGGIRPRVAGGEEQ